MLIDALTAPRKDRHWLPADAVVIARARKAPTFEHLNDLGVALIHQRKYTAAARLFIDIERLFPGRHQTAANLGTTLELMGRDEAALRWIRLGIRRNADEHAGTEWLHARILEANIALKRDPHHLDDRSVAGVVFKPVAVPPLPLAYPPGNDGRPVQPHALYRALSYQLSERLQFVKPKDPVVANLLSDWATLNLAGGPVENAVALYALADRYGAPRTPLQAQREREARLIMTRAARERPRNLGRCPICPPVVPFKPVRPSTPRAPDEPPPPPPPPLPYEQ